VTGCRVFGEFVHVLAMLALGIAMIVIGSEAMDKCPVQQSIPKFLIGKYNKQSTCNH
jgi:hypothetical protein